MNDAVESLRRLLTAWYRQGHPWRIQPTLGTFAACCKADAEVAGLLRRLVARHGPGMEVQALRLRHLIELQPLGNDGGGPLGPPLLTP